MTTSGLMPNRPQRLSSGCLAVVCLLQLRLAWLVACPSPASQFGFVDGLSWTGHRVAKDQVTRRLGQKPEQTFHQLEADDEAKARRLTSRMKNAYSAKKLIDILDTEVDGLIFNHFHASAAYHRLASWKNSMRLEKVDWASPVLLRLHARVHNMVLQDQLDAQGSSNVLLSMAHISDRFSIPTQLLVALATSLPSKAQGMNPQDLSNNLWALASLRGVVPSVLEAVGAIAAQIPLKISEEGKGAKGVTPQHLSNCLWASLQLADEAPEVLQIVPAIVQEIPANIEAMVPQALCNSLDALILHQESVPELASSLADSGSKDGIVRLAAVHLNTLLPELTGKDLNVAVPAVIWGCAKVGVYHSELLGSVTQRLGSRTKLSRLKDFGLCALSWAYQVLDIENDFTEFRELLKFETVRRGLSEADVESSRLGYLKWNRAKA